MQSILPSLSSSGHSVCLHTCLSLCFAPVRAAGEGDVSFAEFYSWWQDSKNKEGALNIDTSAGGEPFTITIVRI